jgi:hypothetical protein
LSSQENAVQKNTGKSNDTAQISSVQNGQPMLAVIEKNKFQIKKDSILKAHDGKLSKDQMAAEFKKAYDKIKVSEQQKAPSKVQQQGPVNNFTVVSSYPQYQKSPDDITNKINLGRIWILNPKGKLVPVFVKTGLNDGIESEVISGSVTAGEQIVISADSNNDQNNTQQKNPLAGQQQSAGQNRGR